MCVSGCISCGGWMIKKYMFSWFLQPCSSPWSHQSVRWSWCCCCAIGPGKWGSVSKVESCALLLWNFRIWSLCSIPQLIRFSCRLSAGLQNYKNIRHNSEILGVPIWEQNLTTKVKHKIDENFQSISWELFAFLANCSPSHDREWTSSDRAKVQG